MHSLKFTPNQVKGFTLIEIMVVVAAIAILSAIAIPNYQLYILRANRIEAKNMLLAISQRMEQNFNVSFSYGQDQAGAAITDTTLSTPWGMNQTPPGLAGVAKYVITFTGGVGTTTLSPPTTTTFTIQATPQGAQTQDECGTLQIDQRNIRAVIVGGTVNMNRSDLTRRCWER